MMKIFNQTKPFLLESGITIPQYHLAYTTFGTLNTTNTNVVWIFHALTANCDPAEWWAGLVGKEKLFSAEKHFIVCVNIPGSCYGSIGPLEINPASGQPHYHDFPFFTTRDMIRAYQPLKEFLQITSIHIGIGGSMGGQQLLEWSIEEPLLFKHIILLATNAVHSPWGIAFNATQRHAIETDSTWQENTAIAGLQGMRVAREIALLSYRNYHTYALGQTEETSDKISNFKSESYQQYQGIKLANRFNAFSYYFLSKSMDAHNVGRNRGNIVTALKMICAKTLVISISSDILFPPAEQEFIAHHVENATYKAIDSSYGHDGFLLEFEKISKLIEEFIA